MTPKNYLLGISALALLISAPNLAAANQRNAMPETINLNIQQNHPGIKGLPKNKKEVKNFSHQKHAETYLIDKAEFSANHYDNTLTCTACHLSASSKEALLQEDSEKRLSTDLTNFGGTGKVKKYFHNICLSCHKALKKAAKTTGPTNCKGCHSRK